MLRRHPAPGKRRPVVTREVVRPPRLRRGGTIALVAPSSQCEAESIAAALEFYRKQGYKVVLGENVRNLRRVGYFSGTVEERARELHAAFKDDAVDAIFAIRGGIGASWLLPDIDYALIRDHPKIFMGYSDVTSLHLAFQKECGLVGFHGPAGGLYTGGTSEDLKNRKANLRRALGLLGRAEPWREVKNPPGTRFVRTGFSGTAEGALIGGNLSLVTELVGTPWAPELNDRLFFFEGVEAPAAGLDRDLVQLYLAGLLAKSAGLIAGEFSDRPKPVAEGDPSIEEVLFQWFRKLRKPAVEGFAIGHGSHKLLLPIGPRARIEADSGRLTITERALD